MAKVKARPEIVTNCTTVTGRTMIGGANCVTCGGTGRIECPNPQFTRPCPTCAPYPWEANGVQQDYPTENGYKNSTRLGKRIPDDCHYS